MSKPGPFVMKTAELKRQINADVYQVGAHIPGCSAVEAWLSGRWNTPWCGYPQRVSLDTLARDNRNSWRGWLRVRCNATNCTAVLLIREDAFLAAFQPKKGELWQKPQPPEPEHG